MKNRNTEVVEILDFPHLKFKCKVCGQVWSPTIKSGGRLSRKGWRCPNGCKSEKKKRGGKLI